MENSYLGMDSRRNPRKTPQTLSHSGEIHGKLALGWIHVEKNPWSTPMVKKPMENLPWDGFMVQKPVENFPVVEKSMEKKSLWGGFVENSLSWWENPWKTHFGMDSQ